MNHYPPYSWQERVKIVEAALAAMESQDSRSLNYTAHRLNVSSASLSRWLRAYRAGGAEALKPKSAGRPRKPKPPEAAT